VWLNNPPLGFCIPCLLYAYRTWTHLSNQLMHRSFMRAKESVVVAMWRMAHGAHNSHHTRTVRTIMMAQRLKKFLSTHPDVPRTRRRVN
jgi:hypothetical protein